MSPVIGSDLYWNTESLAKLLRRNKIVDRKDLARIIDQPYSTVCDNLSSDWSGRVKTFAVLVAMSRTFNAKLDTLVHDPRQPA